MNLSDLQSVLSDAGILNSVLQPQDADVLGVALDSRKVEDGFVFVALKGTQVDGNLFIDKVITQGAIAIITEERPQNIDTNVSYFIVEDAQKALAETAMLFYEYPTYDLGLIGITGTNGKTTTTYLLHHALNHFGEKAGLIGTISYKIGEEEFLSTHTTPDAISLNALFRQMEEAECEVCVMEVSSHALAQDRTYGLDFFVGAFTNLSRDHLDYHQTFEAYLQAKKILFDNLGDLAVAVVNIDDEHHADLVQDAICQVVTYGKDKEATYPFTILENSIGGLKLQIGEETAQFNLVGEFNAYNLACAFSILCATGYSEEDAITALSTAPPVPGRFEQVALANGTFAIIDYAHTPDALENVLSTVRTVKNADSKVWCVFGCGGDRDKGKRSEMGAIAERLSDFPILTSDNPRTENPQQIIDDVLSGMQDQNKISTIIDRKSAIAYAVKNAQVGDVIVIAGKGHENYQIIGTEKFHFDDKEEVLSVS